MRHILILALVVGVLVAFGIHGLLVGQAPWKIAVQLGGAVAIFCSIIFAGIEAISEKE